MGQVGLEWQVAGLGPVNGPGTSDMLMRNSNTGAFEIYDIANNQITSARPMGQVGLTLLRERISLADWKYIRLIFQWAINTRRFKTCRFKVLHGGDPPEEVMAGNPTSWSHFFWTASPPLPTSGAGRRRPIQANEHFRARWTMAVCRRGRFVQLTWR